MKRILHVVEIIICIVLLTVMMVSAEANNISLYLNNSIESHIASKDALQVAKDFVARKISTGQFDKFISSAGIENISEIELNQMLPVYTIYNPSDPAANSLIKSSDFALDQEVTEWMTFAFPKGNPNPILYISINLDYSDNWQQREISSISKGDISDCVKMYNQIQSSHKCSSPVIFRFHNDYGLLFVDESTPSVILPTLLQHYLQLKSESGDSVLQISCQDFVTSANQFIERIQKDPDLVG